jgi:hypothetical protein
MAAPESVERRVLRAALCVLLVFHLAAITITNLPRTTALGSFFHRPFDAYIAQTGLFQSWAMFTTIPYYLDVGGSIVVVDREGRQVNYEPMLPGFAPYIKDPSNDVMFLRLGFSPEYAGYGARYTAAICRALAHAGKPPLSIGFELRTGALRRIQDVARDGRMADAKTFRFGQAPCPR